MAGELSLSGLTGTNFDGGAIVDQIMQLKSLPIKKLQEEKALVQAKLSSLSNLSGSINDFLSIFEGLIVDDLFKGRSATVSDENVLSVTATEDAPILDFSVTVNKTAQVEIRVSNNGVTNLATGFSSSGTLTLSYDTGSGTQSFNVNYSAGDTLEDLVSAINSAQDFVKASVYFDGNKYMLMLSEKDLSSSTVETDTTAGTYVISVSGLPSELGTGLDTLQKAVNAEIVIGSGSPITSPSNTFENVISGVTITVKNTGSSDVSITEDYSKVTDLLNGFVEKFNGLVELADSLTTGENPLFGGDGTIIGVRTGVTERLDPLIELGLIDYDGDTGKISLNTDRLNDLLSSDPESLKDVLNEVKDSYYNFLSAERDVFQSFEDSFNDRIESIDQRIEQLGQRLLQEERILRLEFARLEAFIAQANELRDRLKQFIVTLSEMTGGGRGS